MHAVDRGVGALIKTGEKPLRGRACFVLVVLVRHGRMAVVAPDVSRV